MAQEESKVASQFRGLPMEDLISGPLRAACKAQSELARSTADFVESIGLAESGEVKMVNFTFTRPKAESNDASGVAIEQEKVELSVPFLSLVNTPALCINEVKISFDMEVKESTSEKSTTDSNTKTVTSQKRGWFSRKDININGSVSTHQEHTRNTDCSAKYHVELLASDRGMPEGMSRVYDILHSAIAPVSITSVQPTNGSLPNKEEPKGEEPK